VRPRTAALPPGEGEQRLHQTGEPIGLLQHAADHLLVPGRVAPLAQADLADAADRHERGPQLVRGVGREAPQPLERLLEPREGVVEDEASWPSSSRGFSTGNRSDNRSALMARARSAIRDSGSSMRPEIT
jgi:hypothetical protein